jgi:hypothetical protein
MKKLFLGTIVLILAIVVPIPIMAQVNINIGIPLPPPIVFAAPPEVIVLPDSDDVYVVPDIDVDIYFWHGWWWRFWEGRWYYSLNYSRDWRYFDDVPSFYFDVDPGWRGYYRDHNWHGHPWNYERIPYRRLQQNWKSWYGNQYWRNQKTWGVQGYQPRLQQERHGVRQERQRQYQQRPEVQRHYQWQQQQRQNQSQQPQRQEQRPRVQQPQHSQPQRKPQGGDEEHRK